MPSTAATATDFLKSRARGCRDLLGLGAGLSVLAAILMVVQYRLLAWAIADVVLAGAGLDAVWGRLWPIPLLVAGRAAAVWAAEAVALAAGARVRQSVRTGLMDQLMALGPVRLAAERAGDLAALLVEGADALEPYYARFLPAMLSAVLLPLAVLAAVLPSDWLSAVVLLLTAPLIPLFMVLIGKGAERLNQRQWARLARMSAHFLEVLQGLTTLKLFNASRREAETVARISEDYRLATMSVLRVAFLSALALEFFATVGVAVVAVAVGFRLLWGEMRFEQGLFVLLLAPEFYLPLRSLGAHYHGRMAAIAAVERIAEFLSRPTPSPAKGEGRIPFPIGAAPSISFRNVRLDYGPGRRGLDGADFELRPGTVTALVGPSGAGKSSVVNLLLGFAAPSGGEILVNGIPLAGRDAEEWRRHIAWVPQRPRLFPGTVADNIRLGSPLAGTRAVEEAARLIGADPFIRALPQGYGQPVGEGGKRLSGGQIRLIALCRAALRPAGLLILDEPTASLDAAAERLIGEALVRLGRGRTVLMVAHRLGTVRSAGAILVLDGGRVVEQGTHRALVEKAGLYAALLQSGEALLPEAAE